MSKKLRIVFVIIFFLIMFFGQSLTTSAEDYLIVSVINAEEPSEISSMVFDNYSVFSISLDIQIENPTQSVINVTIGCSPALSPYLETNLENSKLEAQLGIEYLFSYGNISINPGFKFDDEIVNIIIYGHIDSDLPAGEYNIWFDYAYCSTVSVPVVTQKMIMTVTEKEITYFFEYNNSTKEFEIKRIKPWVIVVFIVFGSLAIVPIVYYFYRKRK